jgi:hypothetical protein
MRQWCYISITIMLHSCGSGVAAIPPFCLLFPIVRGGRGAVGVRILRQTEAHQVTEHLVQCAVML